MSAAKPTGEAMAALARFAAKEGRRWKSQLRACWERSDYPGVEQSDVPLLHGLRNNFGPSWLARSRVSS